MSDWKKIVVMALASILGALGTVLFITSTQAFSSFDDELRASDIDVKEQEIIPGTQVTLDYNNFKNLVKLWEIGTVYRQTTYLGVYYWFEKNQVLWVYYKW